MDKNLYDIAKNIYDKIKLDGKYTPQVRQNAREILRFKKTPIMSWYLIYLKGLCVINDIHDMDNFLPLAEIEGIKLHYAVDPQEVAITSRKLPGYVNYYNIDETKFIHAFLQEYRLNNDGRSPVRIIAYKDTVWFIEGIPENFKVVPMSEMDSAPVGEEIEIENEKID